MDVDALLSTEISSGRVALAARVALAQCSPDAECPIYLEALDQALADEPPPFDTSRYAEIYEEASVSARWTAISLIQNAEREGDGSRRLWSLAACSEAPHVKQSLKRHSVDESRHSLLYLALLDLTFPGATRPAFREELNQLSPHFSLKQELAPVPGSPYAKKATIDDFLQMNIAEIRTTIHHIMHRPALTRHCPPEGQKKITSIQDSLLRDELKHVAYTAVLIEEIARELPRERVTALFRKRFRDFNRITLSELGEGVFDCSVDCCTKHAWCRARAGGAAPPASALPVISVSALPILN